MVIGQGILYSTYFDDILYIYPPELYVAECESVNYTKRFLAGVISEYLLI